MVTHTIPLSSRSHGPSVAQAAAYGAVASVRFTLPAATSPRHSLPLMTVQPPFSTIPCKYFYFLANPMLTSPMFSSQNPPTSSLNLFAPSLSFTSFTSSTSSTSCTSLAQILPIFSTPSKHATHRIARNSIRFIALLHNFWTPPGGGTCHSSRHTSTPIPEAPPTTAPLPRLAVTLARYAANADSNQFTKSLNPLDATLTKFQGEGAGSPLRQDSALCASARSVSLSRHVPCRRSFFSFASLLHYLFTSHFSISEHPQAHETHSYPLPSHPMHAVPCGAPFRTRHRELQNGGD